MGIGGHILGEKKLRRLRELTGLDLDRAYIRGQSSGGRVITDGRCRHYEINPKTGEYRLESNPMCWCSCPRGTEEA